MYYIDYPGVSEADPRPIPDRLHDTYRAAVEEALKVYQEDATIPKVIVAEFPTLKRIATVFGPRNTPRVNRRRGRPDN